MGKTDDSIRRSARSGWVDEAIPGIVILVVSFTLGLPVCAPAQAPLTRVTLDNALQLALQRNATLRAKGFELQSVQASEITAGLRPNPTMNFITEQIGLSGTTPQYTVNVGQPIELGGKRRRRIEAAEATTEVTSRQLDDVRRQTILPVKTAFANALIAGEALTLAEQNLKVLDDTERLQRIRVDKGDLSELELLRIQVSRFTFERDAATARQALAAAKIALLTAPGASNIAESFHVVGDLDVKPVRLERADLFRQALDNRPDLQAAEADRKRAEAAYRLAKANAWWDLTPQVEYQRIGPDNTAGVGFSLLDFLDAQRRYRETALAYRQVQGAYLSALYEPESDIGRSLE